ncbi:hypothetical protein SCA6_001329 [Theobroma cacao]
MYCIYTKRSFTYSHSRTAATVPLGSYPDVLKSQFKGNLETREWKKAYVKEYLNCLHLHVQLLRDNLFKIQARFLLGKANFTSFKVHTFLVNYSTICLNQSITILTQDSFACAPELTLKDRDAKSANSKQRSVLI